MSEKNFNSVVKLLVEQWNELKDALYEGKVDYKDIEKLRKDFMFFNRFDNIFETAVSTFEVALDSIKPMFRGAREEVALDNYNRMIPNIKYATGYNRMNPPGEAFIYLGILGENKGRDKNTVKNHILKTVLKELRSYRDTTITVCEFQVNYSGKSKTVLDFRGDINIPKSDRPLNIYLQKEIIKNSRKETELEVVNRVLTKVYFNMLSSDQIFKPVETDDQDEKKYEYAPFHTLANYVREQGYAGIIFNSTVYKNGTNLVLFDPNDVSVIPNSMEHIFTSDFI